MTKLGTAAQPRETPPSASPGDMTMTPDSPSLSVGQLDPFQARVKPWLLACFGEMIAGDREERNHRFLEEALELVQACGCAASEAHQLVDYVYARPVGELHQEVGGVMVTLAALCLANDADMHAAGWVELDRIWGKVEAIRAKQAAKPKHSPLPEHARPAPAIQSDGDAVREALRLARPIVATDLQAAIDQVDADWEGMSRNVLDAIDAALSPAPPPDIALTHPEDGVSVPEGRYVAIVKRRQQGFDEAVVGLPFVAERIALGQQFNAYDSAQNDEDDEDDDCDMIVGIGPVSDFRYICEVTGRTKANLIADALTLAAYTPIAASPALFDKGEGR